MLTPSVRRRSRERGQLVIILNIEVGLFVAREMMRQVLRAEMLAAERAAITSSGVIEGSAFLKTQLKVGRGAGLRVGRWLGLELVTVIGWPITSRREWSFVKIAGSEDFITALPPR